ncbi:hypothetical protein EC900039_3451B, partial [Escherichia coli 90.0039]
PVKFNSRRAIASPENVPPETAVPTWT